MALVCTGLNVLGNNSTQAIRRDRKCPPCERELNPDWWNHYWQVDLPQMHGMDEFRYYLKGKEFYHKTTEASRIYQALCPRPPVIRCLWRQGPQSAFATPWHGTGWGPQSQQETACPVLGGCGRCRRREERYECYARVPQILRTSTRVEESRV